MSTSTENMKEALIKYIRNNGYKGELKFITAGEFDFIEIDDRIFTGITSVTISVAGLSERHPLVKIPYLTYSFDREETKIEYDQSKNLDDFITKEMNYILYRHPKQKSRQPSHKKPQIHRDLTERIQRLEETQIQIHELIDQIQHLISVLDSRLLTLEDKQKSGK